MDNLARNAMLAKQANMSYGKWKAMQPVIEKVEKPADPLPKGWKICQNCGKAFKTNKAQKYCDIDCRKKAYGEKDKEYQKIYGKKYRERQKEGAKNGRCES